MIDADGSIVFALVKNRVRLRLYVYNTFEPLMEWLVTEFGGRYLTLPNRVDRWKPEMQWYLNSSESCNLLKATIPFMIVKKERAELAVEGWENREPTPRGLRRLPIDSDVLASRKEYVRRFNELNKKGRVPRKEV